MSSTKNERRFSLIGGPERDSKQDFIDDVRAGLSAKRKRLSCRFLYDKRGSELFEQICEQPEYYPTRTEGKILARVSNEIANSFQEPPRLVELGSGSAEKTHFIIEALIERHGPLIFEPIDISPTALEASAESLLETFDSLEVRAISAEYAQGLHLLSEQEVESRSPWLVAWLGSSIGNFDRPDAVTFLRSLKQELRPGDALLLGIDMRKGAEKLEAAYDDRAGVTEAFIRNLLVRVNHELGGDFDLDAFDYRAHYDEVAGRVEMALVSQKDCVVNISALGMQVEFARGESIHMENSYKYSSAEISILAREAGLQLLEQWNDDQDLFRVVKLGV